MYFKFRIFIILLFTGLSLLTGLSLHAETNSNYEYQVEFSHLEDEALLCLLKNESKLVSLAKTPPSTAAALENRVNDDKAALLKILQSQAYYHASIQSTIDRTVFPILVALKIDPGPAYTFDSFSVILVNEAEQNWCVKPADLGLEMGCTAFPADILSAEETLLSLLAKQGYPLAKIEKREILADVSKATLSVKLLLNRGPQSYFGTTEVLGNDTLLPIFFCRKIAWREGELYHPDKIQRSLNALELSGLFSSISITHEDAVDEDGNLPMKIAVHEAKQRSIGFGVGYATTLGFGLNGEWEHRNISGTGDKLSFIANLWQVKQEGLIRYTQPDFLRSKQDLILTAEAERENVKAFRETSFSLSGNIERQVNDNLRVSGGLIFMRLRNTHSDNNRIFTLFKTPFQMVWNGVDKMMDPSRGWSLHLKAVPAYQARSPTFGYSTHWLNFTTYQPLDQDQRFILAAKATLGSIWGATKHSIPPSERFYAGSDTLLRGYHYLTVCPLNEFGKPIGGRSLMIYSLEARMRIKDPFGLVFFYDIGNVYAESLPQFGRKQLQSAGIGLRYHTPVGPIRLDVAFPFNPRKHLDKSFQVYFSIGQSF